MTFFTSKLLSQVQTHFDYVRATSKYMDFYRRKTKNSPQLLIQIHETIQVQFKAIS